MSPRDGTRAVAVPSGQRLHYLGAYLTNICIIPLQGSSDVDAELKAARELRAQLARQDKELLELRGWMREYEHGRFSCQCLHFRISIFTM